MYGQHVVRFRFLMSDRFPDECAIRVGVWEHSENSYSGHRETEKDSVTWIMQLKVTVQNVIHANGVLGSYYFNNDTVRGVHYYHILKTYLWSALQEFPQDAVF